MRKCTRSRVCVAACLIAAALGYGPTAGATCPTGQTEQAVTVYLPGRYTNAHLGDVVVIHASATSLLTPVMAQLGESFVHALMVQDNSGFTISENTSNPGMVQGSWTQSHPLNPYDMGPVMPPGVLDNVYADGVGNYYAVYPAGVSMDTAAPAANAAYAIFAADWATGEWGGVASQPVGTALNYYDEITGASASGSIVMGTQAAPVHAGGCPVTTANTWILGDEATGTHGYSWYGLMHNVTNGDCIEFLRDTCAVPMPTPTSYTTTQVYDALSAFFTEVNEICWGEIEEIGGFDGFWLGLTGSKSAICDNAAYEFVNLALENNPWDTTHENWSVPVSTVVSPSRLEAAYTGAKAVVTTAAGGITTEEECVGHQGGSGGGK